MHAIDRSDPRGYAQQLVDDIRQRIATGEFAAGDKLPSLKALSGEYVVSEKIAGDAVRELQRLGLAASTPRGTFVKAADASAVGPGESDDLRSELAELRKRVELVERRLDQSSD